VPARCINGRAEGACQQVLHTVDMHALEAPGLRISLLMHQAVDKSQFNAVKVLLSATITETPSRVGAEDDGVPRSSVSSLITYHRRLLQDPSSVPRTTTATTKRKIMPSRPHACARDKPPTVHGVFIPSWCRQQEMMIATPTRSSPSGPSGRQDRNRKLCRDLCCTCTLIVRCTTLHTRQTTHGA
jgi:hypothetical protein